MDRYIDYLNRHSFYTHGQYNESFKVVDINDAMRAVKMERDRVLGIIEKEMNKELNFAACPDAQMKMLIRLLKDESI